MQTQISSWLNACNRTDKLNILCVPTHERYETGLAKTGHNFYAIRNQHTKNWNTTYAPIPSNYLVFDQNEGPPAHITFDLVLSQNRFGQYQLLAPYAQRFGIPLITLEHTLTVPNWDDNTRHQMKLMRGHVNLFISDYSIDNWGYNKNDSSVQVIRHAVNTDLFKPTIPFAERNNTVLEVANDFVNRDWCLNFSQYMRVTAGLPCTRVGDTPGFSLPAKDDKDLANFYATSRVFINTHHISPIPMSLLEAMSAGCACVSIKSAAIPEYIQDGKNGFIVDNDKDMRSALEFLLGNVKEAERIGTAARQTILEKCSMDRFTTEWNELFQKVILK
jgi:hypothetical protein